MRKALLCILSLALLHQAHAYKWKVCGDGDFKIENATLNPTNIFPGTTATFTIEAVAGTQTVEDGDIVMLVKLSGLPIYTQEDDLCSKTNCPVSKGEGVTITYEQEFPIITPPGSYSVTLAGKSSGGVQLFCVMILFQVQTPQLSSIT